jgi:hypothetical protein
MYLISKKQGGTMKKLSVLVLMLLVVGMVYGQATLPLTFSGPWGSTNPVTGVTRSNTDVYSSGSLAKLSSTGHWIKINIADTPDKLSFLLKAYNAWGTYNNHLRVYESDSDQGSSEASWGSPIADFDNSYVTTTGINSGEIALTSTTRWIALFYTKESQNCGIDDILVTAGSGGGPTPLSLANVSRQYTVPTSLQNCDVQCDITGGTAPYTAVIKYSVNGVAQADLPMANSVGDTYVGTIPAQANGARVEYYVEVTDSGADDSKTSAESGFFWGVSPISHNAGSIKAMDGNGALLYSDYYCTVTGIALANDGVFNSSSLETYVQDAFGGINVFYSGSTTPITEGSSYSVMGKLASYNGKTEIIPDALTDITDNGFVGVITPNVLTIDQLLADPETYENTLVGIMHVNKISGTWGANQNLTISDGSIENLTMRIDGDTNLDESPEPAWPKDVVGIFTQYDSSSPYDSGYQIFPRSTDDIKDDGALPVTLTSFTATPVNSESVSISWTTESESGMQCYNLYRNEGNGLEWITSQNAVNVTTTTIYSFEDTEVEVGATYEYVLEGVEVDGTSAILGTVSATIEEQATPQLPQATLLSGNFPNPFNPATTISFVVKEAETATLTIYDMKGRTISAEKYEAGEHAISWDATEYGSGVYFYKLASPSCHEVKKMIMLK